VFCELLDQADASDQTPGETVKAVDDDLIHLAVTNASKQVLKGRSAQRRTGDSIVVKTLIDKGPSKSILRFDKRAAKIVLDFARREAVV
jgi:hypothetical protein